MRKTEQPPLHIVSDPPSTGLQPSRPLGAHGSALWAKVTAEYDVSDCAGVELLTQACQALDAAEEMTAQVEREGHTVRTVTGSKAHPLIKETLAHRGFVVRTISRLGINYEPLRIR